MNLGKLTRLKVPFADAKLAEASGAVFIENHWYAPEGADLEAYAHWISPQNKTIDLSKIAFALSVPFSDAAKVKAAGAQWNSQRRAWMCPKGKEEDLIEWKVKPAGEQWQSHGPSLIEALNEAGLSLKDSPVINGKWQRAEVVQGKPGNKHGAYIAFDDVVPKAYIKNFKTGQTTVWTASVAENFPSHQQAAWNAEMDLVAFRHKEEVKTKQEATAKRAQAIFEDLPIAKEQHPYLLNKQIHHHGVRAQESRLVIPGFNIDNEITTLQMIHSNGFKEFLAGGKKSGSFYPMGSFKPGEDILLAEGFATAATLRELTDLNVVVAFDAGNLREVSNALCRKFPDSFLLFMADHDRFGTINVGLNKAIEASQGVHGGVVIPAFPDGIQSKGTDWNDLKIEIGKTATLEQLTNGIRQERSKIGVELFAQWLHDHPEMLPETTDYHRSYAGSWVSLGHGFGVICSDHNFVSLHETRRWKDEIPKTGQIVRASYVKGRLKTETQEIHASTISVGPSP